MRRMTGFAAITICLFLALTVSAQAFPVAAGVAILSWIGVTAAATSFAAIAVTAALNIALAAGLSYLAQSLIPKPGTPDISSLPGGTTGKLQTGGAVPRSFIVGRGMTAGSLVYANTYSSAEAKTAAAALSMTTGAAGNTPNAYLVQVIALSDIPVTGLAEIFIGGVKVTWNPEGTEKFEGIAIPEYTVSPPGREFMWVRFYDGTQVAADPQLVALFSSDSARPYASTRIGTGVSYVVVTTLAGNENMPGFPQLKFVLDGIKLYDRRYDSSVGGSGSQRWSTPSTWAFTKNNAVIIENILRGISYGGKWVYGAQTVSATQLPSASWTAAASECDVIIGLKPGGSSPSEPQFTAGGEIKFSDEPASTIEELLKGCNGRLAEIGGTYKMRAGGAGSAVFSFSDADILSTEQQTFDPFPSLGQTINAVTAKYISPRDGWVSKDARPLYNAALETADGGRRQPVNVLYSFVSSGTQVQRLMKAELATQRAMRRHALPMPPDAFVLEPLDVISWTSTRNGYESKLFEVVSADDLPNLNMGIAIKELDPNAYDWDPETDEFPVSDGPITIISTPPQPIVDWNAIPWTIVSDSGRKAPGIKVNWDPDTADVKGVRAQIRIKATGEVIYEVPEAPLDAGAIIIGANLISNTLYQARGQYIPKSERSVVWSDWIDVTTPNIKVGTKDFDDALLDLINVQILQSISNLKFADGLTDALVAELKSDVSLNKKTAHDELINQINAVRAAYTQDIAAAVGPNSAIAHLLANLSSTVDKTRAELTTEWLTGVSGGNIIAQYSLRAKAQNVSAGMRIMALKVDKSNVAFGAIYFDADYINFGKRGASDATFKPLFTIDSVKGTVALNVKDFIVSGSITATMLDVANLAAINADLGTVKAGRIFFQGPGKSSLEITSNPPRMLISDDT